MNDKELKVAAARVLEIGRLVKALVDEGDALKATLLLELDTRQVSSWDDVDLWLKVIESKGQERANVAELRAAGLEKFIIPGSPSRYPRVGWK